MQSTETYPILFGYRDIVVGKSFVAFVRAWGRALLVRENEGYWLQGVHPGAIAAGGRDIREAGDELKARYLSVLFDIAAEADSIEAFRTEVERFFWETDPASLQEWDEAHARVKKGDVSSDDGTPNLPRRDPAAQPLAIEVSLVEVGEEAPKRFNRLESDYAEAA